MGRTRWLLRRGRLEQAFEPLTLGLEGHDGLVDAVDVLAVSVLRVFVCIHDGLLKNKKARFPFG
jgi:hypothetical protein